MSPKKKTTRDYVAKILENTDLQLNYKGSKNIEELARNMGPEKTTANAIRSLRKHPDRNPQLGTILGIANALGIGLFELLTNLGGLENANKSDIDNLLNNYALATPEGRKEIETIARLKAEIALAAQAGEKDAD